MTKTKKMIKVTPKKGLIVNFEGERRRIPESGAEVVESIYYKRMIRDGSLTVSESKNKKETK